MRIGKLALGIESFIYRVSRIVGVIATVFIMAIMILTVADVLLRLILNKPIAGSVELCQLFIVAGGFLGVAWCCQKGGHVKVDIIIGRLSPRWQRRADIFNNILAIFIIPLVSRQLLIQGIKMKEYGKVTDILNVPVYPFYLIAGFGFAWLSLEILLLFVRSLRESIKGGDGNITCNTRS